MVVGDVKNVVVFLLVACRTIGEHEGQEPDDDDGQAIAVEEEFDGWG